MLKKYFLKERPFMISTSAGIKPSTNAFYGPWDSQEDFFTWFESVSNIDYLPSGAHVAIKQNDGTTKEYRVQHPTGKNPYLEEIGAGGTTEQISSDNVIMPNGSSVTEVINSITDIDVNITGAVYFNTVADLKASIILKAGDVAITKGFYKTDDGGGAKYNIINTPSDISTYPANDFDLLALQNNLYADVVIENGKIGLLQIGGRRSITTQLENQPILKFANDDPQDTLLKVGTNTIYDCKDALEAYVKLCNRKNEGIELLVPVGHYFMSPTFVGGGRRGAIITGMHEQGDTSNMVAFHAIKRLQDYTLSVSGQRILNNKNYTQYGQDNIRIKNICFTGKIGGQAIYKFSIVPKVALVCVGANMSYFDGLFFQDLFGAMVIGCTQETHFGLINVRGCGGFYKGFLINPIRFITVTGSYSDDKFAAKVWGVTSEDWISFTTNRNCSALYFNYFNCEGVFGSVIHAELGANFTHSEINRVDINSEQTEQEDEEVQSDEPSVTGNEVINVQWEATMKNIPGPNDTYYPNLMDYRYNPTDESFGWRIGESNALNTTITNEMYEHSTEKIIRCGFVSGDLYDLVIHCVTVTWGTDGQIWGYNGVLYRVLQSAIVCIGSTTSNESDSESGPYTNVNLITYNIREGQSFRALYMGKSSSGTYKSSYPFSCCKPVIRTTKEFVIKSGCPMPRITFVDSFVPNRIYCALVGAANNDAGCVYDSSVASPAHIVRNGGSFSFIYDSTKHYRYYGKTTQTSGVIKVYNGDTVYGTLNAKYSDGEYHTCDLDLESLNIPNGTRVYITITRGSWAFSHIDFYDNAIVYGEPSLKWTGRKWIDDQGVIHTCS